VDGPSTRLHLRVIPGGSRSEIVGRHGDAWKVRIAAPPERNRANNALLDLLATALGISRARIALVRGRTSRDKTIVVDGLTAEDVEARLASPAGAAT
jgi:uncharacterized protein